MNTMNKKNEEKIEYNLLSGLAVSSLSKEDYKAFEKVTLSAEDRSKFYIGKFENSKNYSLLQANVNRNINRLVNILANAYNIADKKQLTMHVQNLVKSGISTLIANSLKDGKTTDAKELEKDIQSGAIMRFQVNLSSAALASHYESMQELQWFLGIDNSKADKLEKLKQLTGSISRDCCADILENDSGMIKYLDFEKLEKELPAPKQSYKADSQWEKRAEAWENGDAQKGNAELQEIKRIQNLLDGKNEEIINESKKEKSKKEQTKNGGKKTGGPSFVPFRAFAELYWRMKKLIGNITASFQSGGYITKWIEAEESEKKKRAEAAARVCSQQDQAVQSKKTDAMQI